MPRAVTSVVESGAGHAIARKLRTARLLYERGGAAALARRIARKLGYRSVIVYELALDPPPARVEPRLPLAFRFLEPDDIDAFVAHCPELGRGRVETMLAEGNRCLVGWCGDEIASSGWVRRGPVELQSLGVDLDLATDEVYGHNGYTGETYRGNRAQPAVDTRLVNVLADEGCTVTIAFVAFDNRAGKRNVEHAGYVEVDALAELSIGPVHIPIRRARRTPARFARAAGSARITC